MGGGNGRCYQEFTKGFCEEIQIIRIKEEDNCTARTQEGTNMSCAFPFILNNKLHTACAVDAWPKTLSEEVEGSPWCPTLLDENLTMVEDNWGLCEENCPIEEVGDSIIFNSKFQRMKLQLQKLDGMSFYHHLTCEDNPCGDPRISLPHR